MKKYTIILLIILVFALSGCSKNSRNSEVQTEPPILELLSEEQLKYLTEELFYTTDAISKMSYEGLNQHLLGTGLELYNPSSGVERYGLDYVPEKEIDFGALKSESDKKITYDEAYAIRLKEDKMRIEDFLDYEFYAALESGNKYMIALPVDGYDDTYVRFTVSVEGESIHMSVPLFFYSRDWEPLGASMAGSVFSILYDTLDFEDYFKNDKHTNEGSLLIGIQYSSVTPKSMVLNINNYTDKQFKCGKGFNIYRGKGADKELLEDFSVKTKEKHEQPANTKSMLPIRFGSDNSLEPGIYTIVLDDGIFEETFEIK